MKQITKNIYYVGINDRQKRLFENLWELPYGVSYNSYIVLDNQTVLVDTVDICYSELFFRKIDEVLKGRKLDYLVINHIEPDHSGSIGLLRKLYPGITIIGNRQTFGMLEGFYGITDGLLEVKDGDTLNIGERTLKFITAPMVHWPEVMFTYSDKDKTLFSADAFGTYGTLDGGVIDREMNTARFWPEMIRYYSNIIGKYGNPVQKALQKMIELQIDIICSAHGPVWMEQREKAIGIYDGLSRYEGIDGVTIAYGSMYGHTEQMAESVASALAENGIKEIAMHDVSKSHASFILRDIFNYRGVVIGSPTYSNQLFPKIDLLLRKIEMREVKNRFFGYFGNFSWAGVVVKRLEAFAETMKWETVGIPVEQKQNKNTEELCCALGLAMAEKLKNDNNQ
jgi:flavorubredoxin